MTFAELTETKGWKNFMAKLYGIGAAVVIVGALFKIMHWPGAGPMLVVGLGTEAVIFIFSSFEPLHEEIDWTIAYPELAGLGEMDEISASRNKNATNSTGEALAKFDEMLEKSAGANIFEKLGDGLSDLNSKVHSLADISDAAAATNDYTDNMKAASVSVGALAGTYKSSVEKISESTDSFVDSYSQSAQSLNHSVENLADSYNKTAQEVSDTNKDLVTAYERLANNMDIDFSALKEGNSEYSGKVNALNKNLAALNAIFELQLNEADLEAMMSDLQGSVDGSRKYNAEVQKLGNRLQSLNTVYGNMLSAMNVNVND